MPFRATIDESNTGLKTKKSAPKQSDGSPIIKIAQSVFEELFGREQAVHAKPLFLKNRTLTVTCSSSVIAQEIRLNQAKIVEQINNKLGKNEVDRIRYLA
ncbi:MAG: DUF721 domain-containing protein [Patescibacteria group bacterium]